MHSTQLRSLRTVAFTVAALIVWASVSSAAARVTIVNGNAAGVGFNDPTPAAPVGGNPGTTKGQQALNAFQRAADIWGATLDSRVEIKVLATFDSLPCTVNTAVLGSAGARIIVSDFPGAAFPKTWYGEALANKLVGIDIDPTRDEIQARFNSDLGKLGCLTGTTWYFGFDGNEAPSQIDLVAVVLHEIGHGLGFQQFASVISGLQPLDITDIYGRHLFDTSTNKFWSQMSNTERAASAINSRHLVWDGAQVHADTPAVLQAGTPILNVRAPAGIAGFYAVGTAQFGPALNAAGTSGQVVQALDAANVAGPSTFDGCSPLSNAAGVAGKIAIVDRGTCTFTTKVKNAQNAGAIAVLVADNAPGGPPAGLGGSDLTITIPSARITLADGNIIKAQLASGVTATLGLDLTRLAGADELGRVHMNAPNPVQPGSSVSHWDPLTMPNQLMEPSISADLTHIVKPPKDLTLSLFRDIGWYPDADLDLVDDGVDACLGSDLRSTIIVGSDDTGVPNTFFTNGCTTSDLVVKAATIAVNHGDFVSAVADLTNSLRDSGIISSAGKARIQAAAARSGTGK